MRDAAKTSASTRSAVAILAMVVTILLLHNPTESRIIYHRSGVKLAVKDGVQSPAPFELSLEAATGVVYTDARLVIVVENLRTKHQDTTLIWSGDTEEGQRVHYAHTIPPLPEGRYRILALFLFPAKSGKHVARSEDQLFLEVTSSGWTCSELSFEHLARAAVWEDIKAAGLDTCDSDELEAAAPELARRLHEFGVGFPPKRRSLSLGQDLQALPDSSSSEKQVRPPRQPDSLSPEAYADLVRRVRAKKEADLKRLLDSLEAGDTVMVEPGPPKVRP